MFTKEQLIKLCKMYEEKLIELMGKKKYYKFSTECAKSPGLGRSPGGGHGNPL